MKKFLFVAESDKIQDLLFRSSRLQEVVGGSQLLEVFCRGIGSEAEKSGGETIISSAGSFRILFDSDQKAREFGEYLSESYRRELGGTISVTDPIEVTSEKMAIENAQASLRKVKHSGKLPSSTENIPYTAICASCGSGIAREYKKRYPDEKKNYVCDMCDRKAEARNQMKDDFLDEFLSILQSESAQQFEFPISADDVAKLERRNYVGYIIADVNNMGAIFGACEDFEKMGTLSAALNRVLNESLAEPTKDIMEKRKNEKNPGFIPVLPLILGGDDVFALIPAQWALDFALQFSKEFEDRMNRKLREIGIQDHSTISVAVVVCKGKLPYSIAHEIGERLLKRAKKRAKTENLLTSMISFRVVTNNDIFERQRRDNVLCAGFPVYTLDELEELIDYRYKLRDLPGTRRIYLTDLFLEAEETGDISISRERMKRKIQWLLSRLDKEIGDAVEDAMRELGDSSADIPYWAWKSGKYYHRLPDLLTSWDYLHRLKNGSSEYEEVIE
jgi:hypothetical protein